jgi:hypothetical protein
MQISALLSTLHCHPHVAILMCMQLSTCHTGITAYADLPHLLTPCLPCRVKAHLLALLLETLAPKPLTIGTSMIPTDMHATCFFLTCSAEREAHAHWDALACHALPPCRYLLHDNLRVCSLMKPSKLLPRRPIFRQKRTVKEKSMQVEEKQLCTQV